MEFINEDSKPRFLLKSRHSSSSSSSSPPPETLTNFSKTHFSCCFSAATAFLLAAFSLSSYSSITFSLLIWFSLSLFLAPFAPQSLTFGDPRVGRGDSLPLQSPNPADLNEPRKRSSVRWNPRSNQETLIKKSDLPSEENKDPAEEWTLEDLEILKRQVLKYPAGELGRWERVSEAFEGKHGVESVIRAAKTLLEKEEDWTLEDLEILKRQISKHPAGELGRWDRVSEAFKGKHGVESVIRTGKSLLEKDSNVVVAKEEEWTSEDLEILKKQISKHPAGAPGRWERVSEIFKGKHGVESVIRAAKSLSAKGPPGDDSFAQFLKQRKPLDKRADVAEGDAIVAGNGGWSSGEDIVLLNALKAFPKDVEMRWEKVAAAVPGKSKADCVKRVAELKRDFRSSKNSES